MKQLQLFERIEKNKIEKKKINQIIKEALENSTAFSKLNDQYQEVKQKMNSAKKTIIAEYKSEADKINEINIDMESDKILLSDLAINSLVKGESIEIVDSKGNRWEPVFSVKYKKLK